MAKIVLDLNQFKASGVYTIEFDSSERVVLTTQTVRLVVGFSRSGPFNAPVFLRDVAEARRAFGTIDAFLENRGSFFHRAIETCLQTGPVFALNLLNLNNAPVSEGGDSSQYRAFSVEAAGTNSPVRTALLSSFFNKERFWYADEEYLQATVDSRPADAGSLLNFANISQGKRSIIIKKSSNVTQFNITARDYYGVNNVPAYMYKEDYLSDYFIDVYVVQDDWTNYTSLSQDPVYSSYFDKRGIIASRLLDFLSLDDVTLLGSFTGILAPNFVDGNGVNQSIDTIINNASAITGVFCNINTEAFDDYENSTKKLDLVGHSLIDSTDDKIDFLSYNTPITSTLGYTFTQSLAATNQSYTTSYGSSALYVTSTPYGGNNGNWFNSLHIPKPTPSDVTFTVTQYENLANNLNTSSLVKTYGLTGVNDAYSLNANDFVKVDAITNTGEKLVLKLSTPLHTTTGYEGTATTATAESNYVIPGSFLAVPDTANFLGVTFGANTVAANDYIYVSGAGYSKYFKVSAAGAAGVTVSTSLSTTAPYTDFFWCETGTAADDFSSFVNPDELSAELFDVSAAGDTYLIPSLGTTFGYVINPAYANDTVSGLRIPTTAQVGNSLTGPFNKVTVYNVTQDSAVAGNWYVVSAADGGTNNPYYNILVGGGYSAGAQTWVNPVFANGGDTGDTYRITLYNGNQVTGYATGTATNFSELQSTQYNFYNTDVVKYAFTETYPGSKLYTDASQNVIVSGDRIKYGNGNSDFNYVGVNTNWSKSNDDFSTVAYGVRGLQVKQFTTSSLATLSSSNYASLNESYLGTATFTASGFNALNYYSQSATPISENIAIDGNLFGSGLKFSLTSDNAALLEVNDLIVNNDTENPHLVRVTAKIKKTNASTGRPYYEYTVLEEPRITATSGVNYVTKFEPIAQFADRFQFTGLNGFTLKESHLPNGSDARVQEIYGVIDNTNIGSTLVDKDVITFRYIVDTFNAGLAPGMGSKQVLSRLAKNRQKAMAILNAPSIAEFQASTDPRFTDLPDAAAGNPKPVLNTFYISTGGNQSLGPSFTWGLPSEDQGAKYCGVFTPNLVIIENNRNRSIPPAADVSNNFIRKFITGQPYAIVAGPRRGVISNPRFSKMEYDFLLRDRENLEPIGLNPIVNVKNVGPMIFANQTAFQRTPSALNNLHVRDLLITIEDAIEDVLQGYLFEFNDASTRLEIRTIVENYLEIVRNGGGVNDYAVIMDETNNTPAIIDQNFGIIDVAVEPARGLQKFINRVTILKTGTISSGGFAAV
jgi:hypothetical protein